MNSKVIPNEQFFTIVESIIKSGQTLEMNIKGSSMYPTLISGKHKIVLAPMRKEYLHKGIIALFLYNGKHVLHRLVAIDGDLLTFQGDNLPYSKEVAKQTDIIAFAEYIITPRGKIIDCKKGYPFTSRFLVFLNRCRLFLLRKTRDSYVKVSGLFHSQHNNDTGVDINQ